MAVFCGLLAAHGYNDNAFGNDNVFAAAGNKKAPPERPLPLPRKAEIALCGLLVGLGGTKKSPARGVVSVIGSVREEVRAVVLVIEKKDVACSNGYPGKRAFGPRCSTKLN